MDQRKAQGKNTTISSELLEKIRPTLKKANETDETNNANKSKQPAKKPSAGSTTTKPALKEDVVFEIDSNNFQKVVLESKVPVLLDIYADWCGPCKQLGPILEEAAIKSGGMFRLAKLNSDKEGSLSEALGVTGLPTVFAIVNGKFTDR